METWFIRPNHNIEIAERYGIVSIGYGINEDITDRKKDAIRKHFEDRGNLKMGQIRKITSLVDSFINGIKVDDTIISPFGNHYKVGKVKKIKCTVASFYERINELQEFLAKYTINGKNLEEIKPAIEVEWFAEVSLKEFPPVLQSELLKSMPAAVNRLKISNFTDPAVLAILKHVEAKKTEVEHGKDEAEYSITEAEELTQMAADEHFFARINSAANRTAIFSVILSVILSVPASKIASGKLMHIPAEKWGAFLILVILIVILWSTIFNSKEWKAIWRKVKPRIVKLFNNYIMQTVMAGLILAVLVKLFGLY